MLENIKSSYIIIKLFSYIDERKKLEIIKYNKNIQKLLNINIVNYKIFSGKYIIYDRNGKGKEFNIYDDTLIFEGEYSNGKRNGKGRELHYDILDGYDMVFEGEFLNGERNGKGREINLNGEIMFEGEYLNGKRHGKGKEFHFHFGYPFIKFIGEYKNGKRFTGKGYKSHNACSYELKNGKGYVKEYDIFDFLLFEGEYINGEKNGHGKEYYKNLDKLSFEGIYLNGKKWTGKGYKPNKDIAYELKDGRGIVKNYDNSGKLLSEYEYINGEKNGKAKKFFSADKLKFEGIYINGKKNGKGKRYYTNGKLYYEGEYLNSMKNGYGKEFDVNGNLIFEGEYLNDEKRKGKKFIDNRLEYEGEYLFGKKWNGIG